MFPWAFTVSNGDTIISSVGPSVREFLEPIYKVLKTIDPRFDSIYYQNEIKTKCFISWIKRILRFNKKIKFLS